MLSPQEVSNLRTSAGLSPTPPAAGSSNLIAQRQAALNTPTSNSNSGGLLGDIAKNTMSDYANAPSNFVNAEQSSTSKNPIVSTLENAGAGTASAIGTIFAPITETVKSLATDFANKATDPTNPSQPLYNNPVVSKLLDFFGNASGQLDKFSQAHPQAAADLGNALTIGLTAAGGGEDAQGNPTGLDKPIGSVEGIVNGANDAAGKVIDTADQVKTGVGNAVQGAKEAISPTLTPEEQVGKIIQGKTSDIPAAQRTFAALPSDTSDITKMSPQDLSDTIQSKIQSNLNEVDTKFANDNNPHPMSDFDQTTGTGKNAVTTNYVQQAIDQLKEHYTATNDAQGLSDMKALEEKANTDGLTSQELNNLAKEHGTEMPKAFSKTGEPLSGLNKQATENTRAGLKTTARNMLSQSDPEGATEVTRLDKETSDAIKTKKLLDNQVEKEATTVQKKGKLNAIEKAAKAHPTITKIVKAVLPLVGAGIIGHEL